MDKAKDRGSSTSKISSDSQVKADSNQAGGGRIWIRDDGAVCIENECIVIQSAKDGATDITVNPAKCACEVGESLYETILKSALTGKGSRITIKPEEDK
jgi:hypothetical protein